MMDCSVASRETEVVRKRFDWTGFPIWLPTLSMMLVSTISYIDRNTLALLAPAILRDTGLSNEQYGFIISGFSIAYMLANPLWGRIVDRIGVRVSMCVAVSLWTLASVSHAFAAGFRSFLAARTALGFGEAATYPGAVRTVTQTLPPATRMRGISIVYTGGSLGALLTPLVITPVMAAWGWRACFWFTGAVGALWLALWAVLSRRRDLARPPLLVESSGGPRWNETRLWAFIGAAALGASPIAFVLYQASIYLSAAFHKSQIEIGHVLWIPPLGWELGYIFWGWATDRFAQGGASLPALRRQFLLVAVLSLPLAAVPRIGSYPITLFMLFFAMFVTAGYTMGGLAYAVRQYSTNHSGLIAGIASGTWSAVVALEMPVVGKLFDLQRYDMAFALATVLPIMGYALWRWLHNSTDPAPL
jgi:MFS transporter, ACS family, hexuronate transporter